MKGDKDTKYMVKQTMYFSDGTETTVEYKPNPNAAEIRAAVEEAMMPQDPAIVEPVAPVVEEEVVGEVVEEVEESEDEE